MATLRSDLIRNSGQELQYNRQGTLTYARYDRVFFVDDITGEDPESVQAVAIATVQASVPVGTQHPENTLALARYYRAVPVNSHKGVEVVVTYIYQLTAGSGSTYTVEMDSGLQCVQTDVEFADDNFDPDDMIPIRVLYWRDWSNKDDPTRGKYYAAFGSATVRRPIGGWTLSKLVSTATANAIEAVRDDYLGGVNESDFRGKPEGTVICDGISTTVKNFAGGAMARLHFSYDPQGWQAFSRFENAQFGVPSNIWRDPNDNFDQETSNGIKMIRAQPPVNLNALVALL